MLNKEKMVDCISNRSLELIILPTEQCNFRCVYCYEDFSIGKMKPNTVLAIKKLISQRIQSLDRLKISWFGGEPLIAKNIVYDISEHINQLQITYPNLSYTAEMTTNGFLLKESVLLKLIALGVTNFQVSLDGTEEIHNQTRTRLNKMGSFQTIWGNLLNAKKTILNFNIMIRIHITPENLDNIYQLIDQIKHHFGKDNRFTVFFKAIENLGGPNAGSFSVIRGKDKNTIINELNQTLNGVIMTKKLSENDNPYVCYAAQTNSLVIRANGKIGKCTVALDDDRNSLGELRDDGTLHIAHDKLRLWTRGLKSQNINELSCPMYHLPQLNPILHSIPIVVENSQ